MVETQVKDINNKALENIELPDTIFGLRVRKDILHTAVVNYLANQRQGTHSTKTKGEVRGGGRKPWKQKKTGRARHGSIRSPLWKGGGITFGPKPRGYSYKLPKKFKRFALKTALSSKYNDNEMMIIDDIKINEPKTKGIVEILKNLGVDGKNVLIVLPESDQNVVLSARNIVGVDVVRVSDINTYDVLSHNIVMMTKDAVSVLKETHEDRKQKTEDREEK